MAARVLLLRSKSPAGIEPRLAKVAATLARGGHEVHVLLWDRERAHAAMESLGGVTIHRYRVRAPEGQPGLVRRLPGWWWHVLRTSLRLRPDVVHAVDLDTVLPAFAAARILRARLVYEIFDFYAEMVTADLPPRLRSALARLERRMVAVPDLVILPDRRREVQLGAARPKRLIEILNVPEDRAVRRPPTEEFIVFYGGMIARDRGLKDLVAACESTGARLVVAGHGPDEADLLPYLESSPSCMYLGTIPYEAVLDRTAAASAVPALYDPAVPNNRLASPNKVFEAMMLSKPVIVSDGTAAADVVREVGCGLVVPYGDREALENALESLMLSPKASEAMGARGRAAFEARYNWRAMETRLLDAYREILA